MFSSTLTPVVLLMIILSVILVQWSSQEFSGDSGYTPVAVLLLLLIIGVMVIIWRQPQNPIPLYFKVSDLMCPNCPPGVNMPPSLNIQGVRGTAKTNGLFPDPHSVLYIHSLSRHWIHSLKAGLLAHVG